MSSSYGILKLSNEILIQILAECENFTEVTALASTCRKIHSIWTFCATPVIQLVAPRCVIGFDEALVAVCVPCEISVKFPC